MNCDQAFELMTDPSLDDSAALHRHIDRCPRCRQMYETLSPALGLFDRATEAITPDSHNLATSVEMAAHVAVRLREEARQSDPPRHRRRLVVACTVTGVLGILAAFGIASWIPASPRSTDSLISECTWQNPSALQPDRRSDAVVLSCVACHLSPSPK